MFTGLFLPWRLQRSGLQVHVGIRFIRFSFCGDVRAITNHFLYLKMIGKTVAVLLLSFHAPFIFAQKTTKPVALNILYTPGRPANSFRPSDVLGAAFDGHWGGEIDRILTPPNIRAMKSVGLPLTSYRLRTELGDEAWHWNPNGSWSMPQQQQGYWTSDTAGNTPVALSFGYALPRRGNTHDNANDDGFSRLDDGDTNSFWKSNPYLDHHFTLEADSLHPQWVVIDLGKSMPVNALRIHWGNPCAVRYRLEYAADMGPSYFEPYQPCIWQPLRTQLVQAGGATLTRISPQPVRLRFLKITMDRNAYTGSDPDLRDRVGFAIKEIGLGLLDARQHFIDYVHHRADNAQTVMRVSSTDPWHRVSDRDPNSEHAGIDRYFQCGLTSGHPAMLPLGLLYDTPDNMAALVHYVRRKKYPVEEIEMGEEPEGQLVHPHDYAALYLQFAQAVKKIGPGLRLGGPGFAALAKDGAEDAYSFSERQWMELFLAYLKQHGRQDLFNFFSFEWYPFDDICAPPAPQLLSQPALMQAALKPFREKILPPGLPLYITAYGYSAYGGQAEVTIEGALMYADILGQFLALGGKRSFLYGWEPTYLEQTGNCAWGNNMLFGMDGDGKIAYRTAAYYTMSLRAHEWARPKETREVSPVAAPDRSVTAFALLRQAGKWSLALINKDPRRSRSVRLSVLDVPAGKRRSLSDLRF